MFLEEVDMSTVICFWPGSTNVFLLPEKRSEHHVWERAEIYRAHSEKLLILHGLSGFWLHQKRGLRVTHCFPGVFSQGHLIVFSESVSRWTDYSVVLCAKLKLFCRPKALPEDRKGLKRVSVWRVVRMAEPCWWTPHYTFFDWLPAGRKWKKLLWTMRRHRDCRYSCQVMKYRWKEMWLKWTPWMTGEACISGQLIRRNRQHRK